jgi:FAD/FMN-containing dehydrogenase
MDLRPENIDDLKNAMACAFARGERVQSVRLDALNRLIEHKAEDMTATVQAGMLLSTFQNELKKAGQWLPVDPTERDGLTISQLISEDLNGPRRFGFGTIRDHLIGISVVLADGRLIQPGGKVVKNVAGYDVAKLFIGAHGSLGVIADATFKLRPLPETERFLEKRCNTLQEALTTIDALLDSALAPVVLDLHNVAHTGGNVSIVVGFAGTRDEVEWQMAQAKQFGLDRPSSLAYDDDFWAAGSAHKISVLASTIGETIQSLRGTPFVARAGNGIVFYRGERLPRPDNLPMQLMDRLKQEFDPKRILPELRL